MIAVSVSGHWLLFGGLVWAAAIVAICLFIWCATDGDDDERTGPTP